MQVQMHLISQMLLLTHLGEKKTKIGQPNRHQQHLRKPRLVTLRIARISTVHTSAAQNHTTAPFVSKNIFDLIPRSACGNVPTDLASRIFFARPI